MTLPRRGSFALYQDLHTYHLLNSPQSISVQYSLQEQCMSTHSSQKKHSSCPPLSPYFWNPSSTTDRNTNLTTVCHINSVMVAIVSGFRGTSKKNLENVPFSGREKYWNLRKTASHLTQKSPGCDWTKLQKWLLSLLSFFSHVQLRFTVYKGCCSVNLTMLVH